MKKFFLTLFGASALLFATPAFAGPSIGEMQELAEDAMNSDCAKQVAEAGKAVGPAWNNMRQGCAALRGCKKTCRQAKRGAKADVRADKKDCKAECKNKKGKAKRDCNKSCRQDARADKKDIRQAKRNCKQECRGAYLQGPCKSGRQAFWKEIANTIKSAGPACVKDAQEFFNG